MTTIAAPNHARYQALSPRLAPDGPAPATDAERALLAAVIVDPSRLDAVDIQGGDFADSDLGGLFEALRTIHEAGLPIGDPRVLILELERHNIDESVRTSAFIGRLLTEGRAESAHATYYAQQVARAATLRRQHLLAGEWLGRLTDPAADPQAIASWLDSQLQAAGARAGEPARDVGDVAADILADIELGMCGKPTMTGFPALDDSAGGWMPGELVILAARPGVGKTSFALQVAEHNAARGRRVLFVSLEMRDRELVARMLCGNSAVDSRRLRAGRLNAADLKRLQAAAADIVDLPVRLWAPPSATLAKIRGMAKREVAVGGLALLVVDYLGLIRPAAGDTKRPRFEQVGEVSAGLKAMAKELDVPVLALCQLNREADGTEPRLSNLRDSGAIEQDADVVLFLSREETSTKLIVAKHRHGETGAVALRFDGSTTRFSER